ncbi:MAG: tyrosine-type recombinase/integrase [Bryobacteraceae bacterium]
MAIVPYIPMLQERNVRKGFFEHDDYLKLRDALPADIRPIRTFGYYTACRRAEMLSLEWRQVDLAEQVVRLDPNTTKNDDPRLIPLDGELYETLAMQRAIRDAQFPASPWVFSRGGEKIKNFQKSWDNA